LAASSPDRELRNDHAHDLCAMPQQTCRLVHPIARTDISRHRLQRAHHGFQVVQQLLEPEFARPGANYYSDSLTACFHFATSFS
jgi:hypothetical protein